MSRARITRLPVALVTIALLAGCSSILRNPVPEQYHESTSVLGRTDLRIWGDVLHDQDHVALRIEDEKRLNATFGGIMDTEHHYLAISGGGAEGAYGAGVLLGWTELGTRPEFTMVTGVSTGALTAPFAFLGEEYDDELKLLYTSLDSSRIFLRRGFVSIVRGDSLADNTPLLRMLETYIDDKMISAIAREHRRGRGLYIGTTNLDAGRSVIWNIGRIANSGAAGAKALIHQILLASAAVPGVFPPSYISVTAADGRSYDEMHVDGGTSAQMFLYPSAINWREVLDVLRVKGTPKAYVIRNSKLISKYEPVDARLMQIAGRSVSSLIRTQGIGDAFRIAAVTQRDGVELAMTWIPMDAPSNPGDEVFDPKYMKRLFEYGYKRTLAAEAWHSVDLTDISGRYVRH